MNVGRTAVLGVGALVGLLTLGSAAHAQVTAVTIDKCLASQIKIVGKGAAALTGCHAKGAGKGIPTDGICIGKAQGKIGPALDKLELKKVCPIEGTGATRTSETTTYAASVDAAVGHAPKKCDAAKTKNVGKYVAAVLGCYAKAAGKTGTIDPNCLAKAAAKLVKAVDKAETGTDCSNTGQATALTNAANAFADAQTCALDPGAVGCPAPNPDCGNGVLDAGEDCDPAGGPATSCQTASNTSAAFACSGSCECACPSTVTFSGDANAAESVLDTGWTGISHRAPIISGGDVTIALSCAATSRPCGTCNVSGPVANPNAGAGQLDNQRCSHDSSISCTNDGQCGGGNTCEFYFGGPLPLAAGGVSTCVYNQFSTGVTGTANVETGEAVTSAELRATVYNGIAIDNPCPRCIGDGAINDGVAGGVCSGGTRNGMACDANGEVPGRPDFGFTSLDCPMDAGGIIATLPIDLSNETNPVVKTLTTASPNCSGSAGEKCLCDTCNNSAQEPCMSNADCPANGGGAGICGGNRCIGGTEAGQPCQTCIGGSNHGAACQVASQCPGGSCANPRQCVAGVNAGQGCTNNAQCPGSTCASTCDGGQCNRPGEPTRPSACLDDTNTPNSLDCFDLGNGEGECGGGPVDNNCSVASGHAQRGCLNDTDCGGGLGSCESVNRKCFLTGGGSFQGGANAGTDTLIAEGQEDTPVNDVSNPTLGSVFCVGPTGSSSVNNVAGLPGPSRITLKGTAVGLP